MNPLKIINLIAVPAAVVVLGLRVMRLAGTKNLRKVENTTPN